MEEIPERIGKLGALVTLKICSNSLKFLPQSLGSLEHLKYLDASKNELTILPGSIRNLRLAVLNVSHNNFVISEVSAIAKLNIFSLLESSARVVLKSRFVFSVSRAYLIITN